MADDAFVDGVEPGIRAIAQLTPCVEHAVTDLEAGDVLADFADDARRVVAEDRLFTPREGVTGATTHLRVDRVHRYSLDLNQEVSRADLREGDGHVGQAPGVIHGKLTGDCDSRHGGGQLDCTGTHGVP